MDRSWLFASRKLSPSFSPADAAVFKNDLYFVPASVPLMVACSCPRMASCSSIGTFAFVAEAPSILMAPAISVPLVL